MNKSLLLFSIIFLLSCSNETSQSTGSEVSNLKATTKQLNISILWDLSDRIDPKTHSAQPEHYLRDIEIINEFSEYFKQEMDKKGAYNAKGKIKVFFTPEPPDKDINEVAKKLYQDLSIYKGDGSSQKKKNIFDSITSIFNDNARKICELTIANKKWVGSDIWRFFKDNIDECIEQDSAYKNILVIITDGYIYHRNSLGRVANRTEYITPAILKDFRNSSNWQQIFNDKDYGLVSRRHDLQNLNVLVLEIQPEDKHPNDEEYIHAYLTKWFKEMGIRNSEIYNSELPAYTKKRIENFLNKK